ncbi:MULTISPECIES: rhodanese-like domain-containing protein [Chryseobacterium]|uniref:Phage shock protein E n=1 Tax=Chryseobacterium camelliae TaxID=1265445 RepID=A0ABU0TP27_9FLAO|nr:MULTISPECIES: rhodanese-like domain-containing protein [Chryseobacterium]MDQ1098075.1 phage shock protein E [Chryseobacterium camelliae]
MSIMLSACKNIASISQTDNRLTDIINSADVVLVDVRIPEQYREGTADRAVNIPLRELPKRINELKGKKVVVFCNKGIQADQAMQILKKNRIKAYDGTTWKNIQAIQHLNNTENH